MTGQQEMAGMTGNKIKGEVMEAHNPLWYGMIGHNLHEMRLHDQMTERS